MKSSVSSSASRRVSPYFTPPSSAESSSPSSPSSTTSNQITLPGKSPRKVKKSSVSPSKPLRIPRGLTPEDSKLPFVHDCMDTNLELLFVGINPGIASSSHGHHYAGANNHFWPCLNESGLVPWKNLSFLDDRDCPRLFRIGFCNLADRPTRSQDDLDKKELKDGAPVLVEKIKKFKPRIAAFVGKGIYEIFSGRPCKEMGLQKVHISWEGGKTLLFVMPSTSGRTAAYQKPQKLEFFRQLCGVRDEMRAGKIFDTLKLH